MHPSEREIQENMAASMRYQDIATQGLLARRSTLRDRLKDQIERHAEQRSRVEKANELFALLEKNPEIARILELIEDLQA